SIAAAKQLYSSQSFPESEFYFEHAYEMLTRTSDTRKWDVGFKLIENRIHTGKLKEGLRLAHRLRRLLRKPEMHKHFYRACVLQFDVMRRLSDYTYLNSALRLLKSAHGLERAIRHQILHLAGSGYFWLGKPEEAEEYLKLVTSAGDRKEYVETVI